jgi:tyrosine-protein kinase Etk/Wzc
MNRIRESIKETNESPAAGRLFIEIRYLFFYAPPHTLIAGCGALRVRVPTPSNQSVLDLRSDLPNATMNLPIQQVQPNNEQDETIDLAKYFNFLLDNRWLIAGVALAVILLGVAYAYTAKPTYEANILLQVQEGAGSTKEIVGDLSNAFDFKTEAVSEMEILRSRMVVSRAVDNLRLYIHVQPKYFPIIGEWLARRSNKLSDPGLLGYGGYVRGTERADVSIFNVPEALEDEQFVLTADGGGNYRLSHKDQRIEFEGRVGSTVKVPAGLGLIELRVDQLLAKPGAQFLLTRSARLSTIERLQASLTIAEKGKQSGIIGVSLEGSNPKTTSAVLNQIAQVYISQNVERKAEEAQKSLIFLNKQLPDLKQELERSEAKYNKMRNARGTIDLGEESKNVLQQSATAQTRLVELGQKKEELLVRFQDAHPAVQAIDQQARALERELGGLEARIKRMPAIEQEIFRLTRDVKVNTDLYTSLLNTAQQLRLITASKVGSARLLDMAEPPRKPAKPKRLMVVSLAALMGVFLGVVAAFVRKRLGGRIDDPAEVEKLLGLPVSATIPHTESQEKLYAQIQGDSKQISVLPHDAPSDVAIESLRGFRTSLQFSMLGSRNNIIMITGPTPGVGKSFVSANFAAVLAAIGKKVLLIDGDLRKGLLHRYFGRERRGGLSDAIAAEKSADKVIHKNVVENVDFISTGDLPLKPAELLAHPNFGKLLQLLSARYDFVLIDTAPVLAVSDPLVVAAHAGTTFNIVRGGVSTVGELEEAVKRLNRSGAKVTGIVFNGVKARSYGYGPKYGKYAYDY